MFLFVNFALSSASVNFFSCNFDFGRMFLSLNLFEVGTGPYADLVAEVYSLLSFL